MTGAIKVLVKGIAKHETIDSFSGSVSKKGGFIKKALFAVFAPAYIVGGGVVMSAIMALDMYNSIREEDNNSLESEPSMKIIGESRHRNVDGDKFVDLAVRNIQVRDIEIEGSLDPDTRLNAS